MRTCIVNIGLYRTGSTTLSEAARKLGLKVHRVCPKKGNNMINLETLRGFLFNPSVLINEFIGNHSNYFIDIMSGNDFVCDGWFPLLAFATTENLEKIIMPLKEKGVKVQFIATKRSTFSSYLKSELHHWVLHDIENEMNLSSDERSQLENTLLLRFQNHMEGLKRIPGLISLELDRIETEWGKKLSMIKSQASFTRKDWNTALLMVGRQNCSPGLPVQAILLTMRIVENYHECIESILQLLEDIEKDSLCCYILAVALDKDEFVTKEADDLKSLLESRPRMKAFHLMQNKRTKVNDSVPICHFWNDMARFVWEQEASWAVFLGDDIRILCSFHYRAIYRSFLDIQKRLNIPGHFFGCPWFNDVGFQGFPTFPVVGRDHYNIFQDLIPKQHHELFVNQDLDPYLQRLYLKFGAAPLLPNVKLTNGFGGSDMTKARYKRVSATSWRNEVLNDVNVIESYLRKIGCEKIEENKKILLDVVIPTYRIDKLFLEKLCNLKVPSYMRTTFIVVVDNPGKMASIENVDCSQEAARLLEKKLSKSSENNIRVRCNKVNLGASATRNRGIDESSAEYILFLDDDVVPSSFLLDEYGKSLKEYLGKKEDVLGLVGLVQFPRKQLNVLHAAVIMSYLVFMFEIAENDVYSRPAWGVTANILYKRIPNMSFDTRYAKTGGGEDVDFALRMKEQSNGLKLRSLPQAQVVHPFWKGGIYSLSHHFFNWAIGDGALFTRFPELTYCSFPNFPETWCFFTIPLTMANGKFIPSLFISTVLMFLSDFFVDAIWNRGAEFSNRCQLLYPKIDENNTYFSPAFILGAHLLANLYIIILEIGRLYGHIIHRREFLHVMHRFDWHCGLLPKSIINFRLREGCKFVLFIFSILIAFRIDDRGYFISTVEDNTSN